jgi:uncharacterized protein YjbI with pentapeptide repeats
MLQNFSGQNLKRRNFQGQNLTGANFSHADLREANFTRAILQESSFSNADIRGANFTNADLTKSKFNEAIAGMKLSSIIFLMLAIIVSLTGMGFAFGIGGFLMGGILNTNNVQQYLLPIEVFVSLAAIIGSYIIHRGDRLAQETNWDINNERKLALKFSQFFIALGLILISISIILNINKQWDLVGVLIIATILVYGFSFVLALAVAGALVIAGRLGIFGVFVGTMCLLGSISVILVNNKLLNFDGARCLLLSLSLIISLFGTFIGYKCINNAKHLEKFKIIIIDLAALGGTSFRGSNLTEADFTRATLSNTDFRRANLTRSCWYSAHKIDLARIDRTILESSSARNLLINPEKGNNKSYIDANLRGAYLVEANLSNANLSGADISDSNFSGANLEGANLSLVQAVNANFNRVQMTGACLEAWNVDSSTKLENVDCRFIYLLKEPKPGSDGRERRPSSGEFAPGEFTKLFQEVLTTVDLIFRTGIDWKAFIETFKKVQVENEDTELTIQSIENKGDGVFLVRVSVPPDTNKEKIHSEFTQNYELARKAVEEKYQGIIAGKEGQIEIYRQQLEYERQRQKEQNASLTEIISMLSSKPANVPVNVRKVEAISEGQLRDNNLVILTLENGNFQKGFSSVIAQIWTDGKRRQTQHSGQLPPAPEIVELYDRWQSEYNRFIAPLKPTRMDKQLGQVTNFSTVEMSNLAKKLENKLNQWLISEQFSPIDRLLRQKFNPSDELQIIIQSQNQEVRKLPWHLWEFFTSYRYAEIALSAPFYDRVEKIARPRNEIRILSILGDSKDIDTNPDREIISTLVPKAQFLHKPNPQELYTQLWSEQGWDILCFSGHSSSKMDGSEGYICINNTDKLTIPDLKYALRTAIARGLQIAIFNSCDGLGLARQLAELHIPQIIVFREPVPDRVAQEFLKNFLTAFAGGKSFYLAVREAREKLHHLEPHFPCATWLPVICQNPAEVPPTWRSLQHP